MCIQVLLNEEIDPNLVIKRLKQEVKDLKVFMIFLLLARTLFLFLLLQCNRLRKAVLIQ